MRRAGRKSARREVLAVFAGRRHPERAECVLVPPPVETAADPDLLPPRERCVSWVVVQLYLQSCQGTDIKQTATLLQMLDIRWWRNLGCISVTPAMLTVKVRI